MLLLLMRRASGLLPKNHNHNHNFSRIQSRKLQNRNLNRNRLRFFTSWASRLDGLDKPTVWHEFSPLAQEYGSVNLGQGFPDWDPPQFVIDAMKYSTDPQYGRCANQYARSYAHMPLATVLAEDYSQRFNKDLDPATQIATASGVTNILYCALQGLVNPGDEVVLLEPAFDIYASQVQMAGGTCVYCPLRPDFTQRPGGASKVFTLDLDELQSKITSRTKVLILNTPHNPTGKMFSQAELEGIAKIVLDHPDLVVLSDEVYEHITFDNDNEPHLSIAAAVPGMWDRTLTMSSAGKTFSCTGWKVGWAVGPPHLVKAVTAVQQWVNFSSATPTQDAIAQALVRARDPYEGYDTFYDALAADYKRRRQLLMDALQAANMDAVVPPGGFFIMADTSHVDFPYEEIAATQVTAAMPVSPMPRDWALCRWLTQEVGVTAIPPSSFYSAPNVPLAQNFVRFAFCKGDDTIRQAHERLDSYFSK
jgi:kynurenine--oxoglutarate transaminase/cysteine-S-conjugate beta-lyase/glutamine--phenylpyruvate transaminase